MASLLGRRAYRPPPVRGLFADRPKPAPDVVMFAVMAGLLALSTVMVYSATFIRDAEGGGGAFGAMTRQMIFAGAGLGVFIIASLIDYREYRRLLPYIYGLTILGLIVVLFFPPVKGANRWIPLGAFQLQPSEFAKVALVVTLAGALARAREEGMRWRRMGTALALMVPPCLLIFIQPDLGTMLSMMFLTAGMLFAAGLSFRQLAVLLAAGAGGVAAVFRLGLLQEYQINRLSGFLDQSVDLQGMNWNINQSKIAIGSGQMFGRGLLEGTQTGLDFVPSQTTDFIFTAVAEQLGFFGGLAVLLVYVFLIWRILMIAASATDRFGSLIAVGMGSLLAFHIFINIGMTMGVAPVTGLPLPFMSVGGSAIIAMSAGLGIVNSVWRTRSPLPPELSRRT